VALGFGPEGLVLNSGEFQQLVIPWKDFLQDWRKMGNFAIFVNGLASPQPTARDGAQGNHGGLQAPVKSHEVLDPAKIPQSLNLPVGLDLPSDMAETVPARRPVPLGQPKNAPAFLTGVALPSPSGNLEQPVVDMSLSGPAPSPDPDGEAHEDAHAQPHSDLQGVAQAKGQGRASERKAAAGPVPGGLSIVMESLPLPDEGPSFTQSDVGTPLALPVVPLPEEQPIAGELIGSDFKGPATVPGARTPSQAMGAQAAAANGQQAPPSDQKGAAEPSGARQANAQKPLADGSYGEASGQGWDGVPLILPVVPLPDMATVSGESAAPGSGEPAVPAPKGTAVTTGSLAPSQAGRPKKAEGSGASTAMPSEETPVMGWER
jgi:hypothetical protein